MILGCIMFTVPKAKARIIFPAVVTVGNKSRFIFFLQTQEPNCWLLYVAELLSVEYSVAL